MKDTIKDLAEKLGADVVTTVPDYSAGAFGVAKLAETLRERLEPGQGKRPGRPTNPSWVRRSKVPLAAETVERLEQLAQMLSDEHRKVSPMQVAAQLLEEATARTFVEASRWLEENRESIEAYNEHFGDHPVFSIGLRKF